MSTTKSRFIRIIDNYLMSVETLVNVNCHEYLQLWEEKDNQLHLVHSFITEPHNFMNINNKPNYSDEDIVSFGRNYIKFMERKNENIFKSKED